MDLIEQLKRDEGLRLTAYADTEGIMTIGYGHNLQSHGQGSIQTCTHEQAEAWLQEDAATACAQLSKHLPWTDSLDDARRGVLQNMAFNLGIAGLLSFHRTLTMISMDNFTGAAEAMLESKWAHQVGARALRLSEQMRTGVWQ